MTGPRTLDFLVIGAAKSATTTLWQGLASHPQLCLPGDKERGFFNSDARYVRGLRPYLAEAFEHARPGQLLGTVTPMYMASDGLGRTVARMRRTTPDVRLVAILRDPVQRAVSRFRQTLRRGEAGGATLDAHLGDGDLRDQAIVADGEYGRILSVYRQAFPRHQLHVLFTEDFERWPALCYRELFAYLGVDRAHVPPLELHLNRGGARPRVDEPELAVLIERLRGSVWPHVPHAREPRRALEWWLRHLWNIEPDAAGMELSPGLRERLEAIYLADAVGLSAATGVTAPWVERYAAVNPGQSAMSSAGQIAASRSTSAR